MTAPLSRLRADVRVRIILELLQQRVISSICGECEQLQPNIRLGRVQQAFYRRGIRHSGFSGRPRRDPLDLHFRIGMREGGRYGDWELEVRYTRGRVKRRRDDARGAIPKRGLDSRSQLLRSELRVATGRRRAD